MYAYLEAPAVLLMEGTHALWGGEQKKDGLTGPEGECCAMQVSQVSVRTGAILSMLGGALIIYGLGVLPMAIGAGGGSMTPHAAWEVLAFFMGYLCGPISLLAVLPLLLVFVVLGMNVFGMSGAFTPRLLRWRRRAALAALVLQVGVSFLMIFIYTFGFDFGSGFWVTLLGFLVVAGSTWLA